MSVVKCDVASAGMARRKQPSGLRAVVNDECAVFFQCIGFRGTVSGVCEQDEFACRLHAGKFDEMGLVGGSVFICRCRDPWITEI